MNATLGARRRARYFAATAEVAAVLIAVINPESMQASGFPVDASNKRSTP
jgi:hypothetical protein